MQARERWVHPLWLFEVRDSRLALVSPMNNEMTSIAANSSSAPSTLAAEIGIRVAVKAKNVAEQQGAAMISLLESAGELSQSLAAEPGKGTRLDVIG